MNGLEAICRCDTSTELYMKRNMYDDDARTCVLFSAVFNTVPVVTYVTCTVLVHVT